MTRPHERDHRRHMTGTRPTRDIYEIIAYTQAGAPIRVIDRAVETFRLGGSQRDVADRCGVAREVVREWIRRGTVVSSDIFAGRRLVADLTRHERKCFDFVQLTAQAEADGKVYLLGLAEQLASGGYVVETITEKVEAQDDGTMRVLERTVKRAKAAPDGQMIRWRLATRWPEEFAQRGSLELTGPDGGPVQIEAVPIIDRMLGELDRIAINTTATDELLAAVDTGGNGQLPPAEPQQAT